MTGRRGGRPLGAVVLAVALATTAACSDDAPSSQGEPTRSVAPDPRELAQTDGLFHGIYVGKASGSPVLVAVSASPPGSDGTREVSLFVTDGSSVFEHFPAAVAENRFSLSSGDGDATATGTLTARAVTGSVKTSAGRVDYRLRRASGAAGLYELEVAATGELTGASPAGVGASGALTKAGRVGHLDLADGRRLDFRVSSTPRRLLPDRQARIIVLPDGRVAGMLTRPGSAIRS